MSQKTETLGLNRIRRVVEDELGWIWRGQDYRDHGIDGFIELGDEISSHYEAFGKLIAVQCKSGRSYIGGTRKETFRVPLDKPRWIDYWGEYSIPVIVVVYNPITEVAHWSRFPDGMAVSKSSSGEERYSLMIPKTSRFDKSARARLVVTAMSGVSHILSKSHWDLLHELRGLPIQEDSQGIDNDVRELLFMAELNALATVQAPDKGLIAVDTSLEDFGVTAWEDDESYKKCLSGLLDVVEATQIQKTVQQVYSIRRNGMNLAVLNALNHLLREHHDRGIRVGIVRRDCLAQELDRDFCCINGNIVLDCDVRRWAQSVPLFGKNSCKFYAGIFEEISHQSFWLDDTMDCRKNLALSKYFDLDLAAAL